MQSAHRLNRLTFAMGNAAPKPEARRGCVTLLTATSRASLRAPDAFRLKRGVIQPGAEVALTPGLPGKRAGGKTAAHSGVLHPRAAQAVRNLALKLVTMA